MKGLDKDGGISPKIQFRLRAESLKDLKDLVEEANDRAVASGQEPEVTMSSLCRMWVELCITQLKAERSNGPVELHEAQNVFAAVERLREAGK